MQQFLFKKSMGLITSSYLKLSKINLSRSSNLFIIFVDPFPTKFPTLCLNLFRQDKTFPPLSSLWVDFQYQYLH